MRPLVIGVGNPHRGDDGAGRAVARRLKSLARQAFDIEEANGEAASLLSLFQGRDMVVLVDACQSGEPSGSVQRFDVSRAPLPSTVRAISSHGFGVADAIELARSLGELPSKIVVIAIECQSFEHGTVLTPDVERAVDIAIAAVHSIVGDAMAGVLPDA
jgi:hydrogenase maturation protease